MYPTQSLSERHKAHEPATQKEHGTRFWNGGYIAGAHGKRVVAVVPIVDELGATLLLRLY